MAAACLSACVLVCLLLDHAVACRMVMTIIIALVLGTLYLNQGQKVETFMNVNNVIGALYLFAMFIGYQNTLSVQPVTAYERTVGHPPSRCQTDRQTADESHP
jgi:ABC-2 type transporter